MQYAVYADLGRPLTDEERSAVAAALDAKVPGSGCVGMQNGPNDELYFCLEAAGDAEAEAQAVWYAALVFREAGLDAEYTLTLQTTRSGKVICWRVPDPFRSTRTR